MTDAYRAVRQFERLFLLKTDLNTLRGDTLGSSVQEGRLVRTIVYYPDIEVIEYKDPVLKE